MPDGPLVASAGGWLQTPLRSGPWEDSCPETTLQKWEEISTKPHSLSLEELPVDLRFPIPNPVPLGMWICAADGSFWSSSRRLSRLLGLQALGEVVNKALQPSGSSERGLLRQEVGSCAEAPRALSVGPLRCPDVVQLPSIVSRETLWLCGRVLRGRRGAGLAAEPGLLGR